MALVDTLQMVSVFSMPSDRACFSAASVSAVSPDCENGDHQRTRVGHAVAVAVFAGDFHGHGDLGDGFDPVFGRQAGVVAGAAGQDQQGIDVLEDLVGAVAEQFRRDGLDVL
jgi:hypothetical protein